ncbi:MAG: hypothetical protein I8H71_00365 [Xanthomonadaceae bacterium]|nr:hypothetical protein [Xanthomonadaceae bacterium]MBH2008126.1 hypothetical protein [Xanthomonadaceae bacterium]
MTLEELIARRANYLTAEAKILDSQEYQVGQGSSARRNRRADLAEVRDEIAKLSAQIAQLQSAASGVRRVRYIRAM